jgi:uncharacterized protein (DUF427 family)
MDNSRPRIVFEPSAKRIRAVAEGKTVADSLCAGLMLEAGHRPVYYFPKEDLRGDLLIRSDHRTHCPYKGEAAHWTLAIGGRRIENTAWSYEEPIAEMARIKGLVAFYWDKIDHWFEEDEEIFGHPRDPYHRVDVRPSSRRVTVSYAGETIARTGRALFLFETGMPTRYYIPWSDARTECLRKSRRNSVCPYKGTASYWSIEIGDRVSEDAVWSYLDTLPECPRIRDHLCFYPEKVDRIEVEGDHPHREAR